jgi:hypothetical protein
LPGRDSGPGSRFPITARRITERMQETLLALIEELTPNYMAARRLLQEAEVRGDVAAGRRGGIGSPPGVEIQPLGDAAIRSSHPFSRLVPALLNLRLRGAEIAQGTYSLRRPAVARKF